MTASTATVAAPRSFKEVWLISIGHGLTHWYVATFYLLLRLGDIWNVFSNPDPEIGKKLLLTAVLIAVAAVYASALAYPTPRPRWAWLFPVNGALVVVLAAVLTTGLWSGDGIYARPSATVSIWLTVGTILTPVVRKKADG